MEIPSPEKPPGEPEPPDAPTPLPDPHPVPGTPPIREVDPSPNEVREPERDPRWGPSGTLSDRRP